MNFLLPDEHFLCHVPILPVPVDRRNCRIRDSKIQKFHGKGSSPSGNAGNQTTTSSFAATTSPLTLLEKTFPGCSAWALFALYQGPKWFKELQVGWLSCVTQCKQYLITLGWQQNSFFSFFLILDVPLLQIQRSRAVFKEIKGQP